MPALPVPVSQRSLVHGIVLVGFALTGIGVFLPWVAETQARVYVLGMESGFERQWGKGLLLGAAVGTGLTLLSVRSRVRWTVVGPVLGGIGALTVAIVVGTTPLSGRWSPDVGVYVTLLGGVLVAGTILVSFIDSQLRSS